MDTLVADLRVALRSLKRRPSFALVVITTIAVAFAGTTTIMAVVDNVILRPLAFDHPEELILAQGVAGPERGPRGLSYPETVDWRDRSQSFAGLAAYAAISLNVIRPKGEPVRINSEIVSADFFKVLGVQAALGRTFLADDDRVPDARPVVVISHSLWQSMFDRADVVGETVAVNGRPFTIVGIMPTGFRGLSFDTEMWIPTMMVSAVRPVSALETRDSRWLRLVGRVRRGTSLDQAQRDLDRVGGELAREYPATNTDRSARLVPLREYYLGATEPLLWSLFGGVGFLLLVACANVLSMQLVRAASRRREMALRVALGAGRRRIIRQLLVEGVVLAVVGAAAGVVMALWAVDVLVPLVPNGFLPAYARITIDLRVLAATTVLAIVAGTAFGLVPALTRARHDLVTDLKDGAPSAAAGLGSLRRMRAQQVFVVGQVALAFVLLAGAMLMVRSLREQLAVNPGFRADDIVVARVALPLDRYSAEQRTRFADQIVERVAALPGVMSAAVGTDVPLRGLESGGHLSYDGGPSESVYYARHRVTPDYFSTLGIRIERGRGFTRADGPNTPEVAIVSASMARRLWPDREAVGQRLVVAGTDGPLPAVTVVGVAADVRFRDLTASLAAAGTQVDVYFPFAQETDETIEIVVRSTIDPASVAAGVRRSVQAIDALLPVYRVATLEDALSRQTASARFGSVVLSIISIVATALAAVGIYGLLAFVVGASRREIAIRMALGAAGTRVVGIIVRKGMALALVGAALGVAIAVPSTRALTAVLFGVPAGDPMTLGGMAALVCAVALVACWIPAMRASQIPPQSALKAD